MRSRLVAIQATGGSFVIEQLVGFLLIRNDAPIQSVALLVERTLFPPDDHYGRSNGNSDPDRDREPDAVSGEERLFVCRRTHNETIAVNPAQAVRR